MTLKQKIKKAISNTQHNDTPYTDNYDGFTHWTYSGLVCEVIDALYEDGHEGDDIPQSVVDDYVFQMI